LYQRLIVLSFQEPLFEHGRTNGEAEVVFFDELIVGASKCPDFKSQVNGGARFFHGQSQSKTYAKFVEAGISQFEVTLLEFEPQPVVYPFPVRTHVKRRGTVLASDRDPQAVLQRIGCSEIPEVAPILKFNIGSCIPSVGPA
jgi:hypothetical protein